MPQNAPVASQLLTKKMGWLRSKPTRHFSQTETPSDAGRYYSKMSRMSAFYRRFVKIWNAGIPGTFRRRQFLRGRFSSACEVEDILPKVRPIKIHWTEALRYQHPLPIRDECSW